METYLDINNEAGHKLAQLEQRLAGKVLQKALVDLAKPLKAEMKEEAPKRSGALRRSIGHKSRLDRRNKTARIRIGLTYKKANRKGYVAGMMQERGTRFTQAQPFINPVAEQHLPTLEKDLADFILAQFDNL
ncbi:hypothetical protein GZ77_20485 [Endozoicomonas montiporae]|uniref:Phage protein, HK97 gp10 family n=2 Tax=Endozoicomonas montiporae TaxID=1027273 RepID=A0A081N306_9GAMM|nr:HK97-gp10 family putative phage morphogenesis protein [Endozoicomonas montiporae]AMO58115.1 hypothetical protein EZMO1_4191 [Endozoicomonas montiporae CL-33]KEQ12829.1 hypothetical protein GZ77_20485 [Endozoicomonas montiporae]